MTHIKRKPGFKVCFQMGHLVPLLLGLSSGGARASVVGVAHGTVWGVMPVLVMLFGERGALWGLLAVTQVACLVRAVSVAGGTVGLHSLPDFRLVPSTRIIPAAIN